ncbi:hypothetical protein DASC09_041650 [Saccharomycopsis crataegensis]|uniref:Uncharacterized protein n=1 Tax=Saccharomycopsis crataegensis TaxID=43959 RepID=A0AAV5QQM0_9ASCO|nr:hypothetical protein DASC09_041650 [Saccharomycopsis crataegensis]
MSNNAICNYNRYSFKLSCPKYSSVPEQQQSGAVKEHLLITRSYCLDNLIVWRFDRLENLIV